MARGRPKKWVEAIITEPLQLGKAGIQVVLQGKWHRKIRGTVIISVGGIRWFPYKAKKPRRIGWDKFARWVEG